MALNAKAMHMGLRDPTLEYKEKPMDRKLITHNLLPACPDAFSVKGCLDMHGVFTITRILPHMTIPDSLTQGSFI